MGVVGRSQAMLFHVEIADDGMVEDSLPRGEPFDVVTLPTGAKRLARSRGAASPAE